MIIPETSSMSEEQQHLLELQSLSASVNEYVINGNYVSEDSEETEFTINYLLTNCYQILIKELKELGFVFECEMDEITGDWYTARVIRYLRKHFDKDNLKQLLLSLNTEEYEKFEQVIDIVEADENGADWLLSGITNFMLELYPNSEDWQVINSNLDRIFSNMDLYKHIDSITDKIVDENMNSHISEVDFDVLVKYLNKLARHKENVIKGVHLIMDKDIILNRLDLLGRLDKHDIDLHYAGSLNILARLNDDPKGLTKKEVMKAKDIVNTHKRTNRHHLDYYKNTTFADITKEDLVEIVADMYDPQKSKNALVDKFESKIKNTNGLSDEYKEYMRMCIDMLEFNHNSTSNVEK